MCYKEGKCLSPPDIVDAGDCVAAGEVMDQGCVDNCILSALVRCMSK